MKRINRTIALFAAVAATSSWAATSQGWRKIVQFDCDSTYCYVYTSGSAYTNVGSCYQSGRIAYSATTDMGKIWTSVLMSAFLAGKDFQPTTNDGTCLSDNATIAWFNIR